MGNCFSDPEKPKGQGNILGGPPASRPAQAPAAGRPAPAAGSGAAATTPGRMVGDGFEDSNRTNDPREMARLAAEQRLKESNQRGVQGSGKLAAKLEASKKGPKSPELNAAGERNMDKGQWN